MHDRRRPSRLQLVGGIIFVSLGVLIAIVEVALHIYTHLYGREIDGNHIDLFIAAVLTFIGMYTLNPRRAKDGGQFIIDSTISVIKVIRLGRRKTDPLGVTVADQAGHNATIAVTPLDTEVPITPTEDTPKRRHTDIEQGGSSGQGN